MKSSTGIVVTVGVLVVLGLAVLLPALLVEPEPPTTLPWQIEVNERGNVHVFGLTVGETALAEAEQALGEGEVILFRRQDGTIMIESYFDNVNLSGLDARMVLGLRLPEAELEPMYQRGVRTRKTTGGTLTVNLASEDRQRVGEAVISTVTYMPRIHLDQQRVAKRFGEPAEKWKERETGVVHWLYPGLGLDVAFSESEKEVLQYVPTTEFARLRDPLVDGERLP